MEDDVQILRLTSSITNTFPTVVAKMAFVFASESPR